jgi:two-component system, OmpR family, KDP operon response regulator KdpE
MNERWGSPEQTRTAPGPGALALAPSSPPAQSASFGGSAPHSQPTATILVVEDDALTRQALQELLESEGYAVHAVADGPTALAHLQSDRVDLVLLDRGLPNGDGIDLCQQLRALYGHGLAIILLTAFTELDHRLEAFAAGVDNYVSKPFNANLLLACVNAVLRRRAPGRARQSGPLWIDDRLQIDFNEQQVIVDGERIALSRTELAVLRVLVEHAGRTVPLRTILAMAWGAEYTDAPHYVHVYVAYLRRKIERDSGAPRYILSERGVGYRFQSGSGAGATLGSTADNGAEPLVSSRDYLLD